jgi:TAG lipase/steryl ester hydrolase/phospholipase A2/LPA acyltransferase
MLSGGGILGLVHLGVLKILWELKLLPQIFAGSSAGSMVASFICTRTDDEL